MVPPPPDISSNASSAECLVLVSDTSTEAERLIASLRVRGFKVRDVPLMLLPGRVEAQRPRLVICDGQAARVTESVMKMRQGVWGASVELLLLGTDLRVLELLKPIIFDIEVRTFARPIDVYSVIQRIEEVIGHLDMSPRPGSRSMADLPRVGSPSFSGAERASTPAPRRGRSSVPNVPQRLDSIASAARGEAPEPSSPRLPSIGPPSEISAPDSARMGVPVARMSEELEQLLNDADRRLAAGPMSMQPVSVPGLRLSPEQELDAILPPDVLAALDEPIDLDDEDETSHPAARHRDRPSSMAPRGAQVSAVEQPLPARSDAIERVTGGTSPADDETPVGRAARRGRFTTASGGSEPPGGLRQGSVLTPVPVSVMTHHTHPMQLNSFSQVADAEEFVDRSPAHEPPPSPHHEVEPGRHPESDSVAPGTNPEINHLAAHLGTGHGLTASRDASSTAPPRPPRHDVVNVGQQWEAIDDSSMSLRSGFSVNDEPPPTIATRNPERHSTSTSPPGKGRSRATPELNASPVHSTGESVAEGRPNIEVPTALGAGDIVRALSRCVCSRYSGALAIEDESGIRRVVMREGDFVMVASGIDGESLVAFLIQRGDLDPDAGRLARKLPQFGRHAGAALIAHGYLRQDELWPVLRAHAEWLLGRALLVSQGSAGLEIELPARLSAEPAVFGGATGAEILVEVVRRIVTPEIAIDSMGGLRARIARGAMFRLLSECALSPVEVQLVERAAGLTIEQLLTQAPSADFSAALYVLVELGVLETMASSPDAARNPRQPPIRDGLDDAAVRSRVAIRRGLVDEGDYFALLGIAREATGYEVRHAYLDLRREFEPSRLLTASTADLREDVDLLLEVLDEAYEILRDSARRERYRRALEAPPAS